MSAKTNGTGRKTGKESSSQSNTPFPTNLPFGTPKKLSDGGIKTSLVQLVYAKIMESLDAGDLRPGSRIIAAELAQQLGLSRGPVREAIAVLAGQGLVELLPDRGAMLRPMTHHDLVGIYEMTAPVAALGLKGAALRIGEGDSAARITDAMAAIRSAANDAAPRFRFYLILNEYHYLANAIGEKPYVDFVLRALNVEYWNRLLAAAIDLDRHADKYVENYQRITDAVLAGDGRAAEAIMLYHADWCISLLQAPNQDRQRSMSS